MRKIQTQDVFKLARIMKQTKLKEILSDYVKKGGELGKTLSQKQTENKQEEKVKQESDEVTIDNVKESFGIEVAFSIMEACAETKTENLLYDLIAGIAEKKANDIKTQSLETTIEQIKQIMNENNIIAFFNTASRLTT